MQRRPTPHRSSGPIVLRFTGHRARNTRLKAEAQQRCLDAVNVPPIKTLSCLNRCRIKEAKHAVEALAAQKGIVPPRSGCFTVLALLLCGVLVTWLFRH